MSDPACTYRFAEVNILSSLLLQSLVFRLRLFPMACCCVGKMHTSRPELTNILKNAVIVRRVEDLSFVETRSPLWPIPRSQLLHTHSVLLGLPLELEVFCSLCHFIA